MFPKLQYISQGDTAAAQLKNIREAIEAGCQWVQLRFKNAHPDELKSTAEKARQLCADNKAIFIINDSAALANRVDADGVHLGLTDMPVREARSIVGDKIIGGTANTYEDVLQRHLEGCDYIGLGPFRFTKTKKNLSPILGLKGYETILRKMQQNGLTLPVYSIGGILPEDVDDIIQTGVYGTAVSGVITQSVNKEQIVTQLNGFLYAAAFSS